MEMISAFELLNFCFQHLFSHFFFLQIRPKPRAGQMAMTAFWTGADALLIEPLPVQVPARQLLEAGGGQATRQSARRIRTDRSLSV